MSDIIDCIFDIKIKLFDENKFVAYYEQNDGYYPVSFTKYAIFLIKDCSLMQTSGFSETGIDLVKEWYSNNKQKLMKQIIRRTNG